MALSAFLSILAADLIVSVLSFFAKNYVTSRDSRSNTLLHTLRSVSPTGKAREFILLRMSDLASRIDFKLQEELVVGGANSDGDCSTRLHDYLLVAFPQHFSSLTGAKKAIRKGLIILNAKRASVTDTVAFGDSVQYYTRSSAARLDSMMERLNQTVELVKLEVLYEDDFCAVILKPQGLAVYPAHDSEYASNNSDSKISGSVQSSLLVSLAPTNQSAIGTNGTPLRRPVPVHRLDQATGGLLLIAKTAEALSSLTESFSSRNITKKYRAVVQGNMTGLVDALSLTDYSYLSLYSKERSEIAVKFSIKGKIAETRIRIVKVATMENKTITIVDASPITGRKHQIRRHLAWLGFPIVGDAIYQNAPCKLIASTSACSSTTHCSPLAVIGENLEASSALNASAEWENGSAWEGSPAEENRKQRDRHLYLWAVSLRYPHPLNRTWITVEMAMPAALADLL